VQYDVVVEPAPVLEVGEAGGAAVGPVHHVVRFAGVRRLVTAAGEPAPLVPQRHQAPQVDRDLIGLADVQRQGGAAQRLAH
jgi:hypothetical protein